MSDEGCRHTLDDDGYCDECGWVVPMAEVPSDVIMTLPHDTPTETGEGA